MYDNDNGNNDQFGTVQILHIDPLPSHHPQWSIALSLASFFFSRTAFVKIKNGSIAGTSLVALHQNGAFLVAHLMPERPVYPSLISMINRHIKI